MKDERTPQNTFQWAERIGKNPLYLTGISLSDMGDLLACVRAEKREAEIFCALTNPPLDPTRQHTGWYHADFVERAVLDELKRRNVMQPVEVPQSTKAETPEPKTFAELFKTTDGEALAIKALERADLIHTDATQWTQARTTGAIRAFLEALQDARLIYDIEITPGCKLIAKRFGVKVVKNYPKAKFTERLRRTIKSYLTQPG